MKEDDKKPDECLHCHLIQALNAHAAVYGTCHGDALQALAQVTTQIIRAALGGEQYPDDDRPPAGTATH
jgi:hypothetical protein